MRGALVGSTSRYEPDEVESGLNQLIERRSRRGEDDAQEREEGWKESVRQYNAELLETRRYQWATYFRTLARNHARLSEENNRKAAALSEAANKEGAQHE